MKGRAIRALFIVVTLSLVSAAKDKGPEVTNKTFDAPIDKVYAAAVQVASVHFNLKTAVKEAYTVNFYTGGSYSFVLTAVCTSQGASQTEVAVSVVTAANNPQVFRLRGAREKLRARFWQELQVALDGMQGSSSTVAHEAEVKTKDIATVSILSMPEGAEITVDKKFVGNTPSTLRLAAGDHAIKITSKGYRTWEQSMTLHAGESITIRATLDQEPLRP
jgi:hypothetical protein